MFELKRLSEDAIPAALEKALRYRLLNEPAEAESICQDVLSVDANNQEALVLLLLALTDTFSQGHAAGLRQAREVLARLEDGYERAYYAGIISERQGKARLLQGHPGANYDAYEFLSEAMDWFEKAEAQRPPNNDDALLRWNACARMIMANRLTPRMEETVEIRGE
jgi:tetratricopeptide (TPR) repeat protein